MGAATRFFLRQRGRSVILLERGLVGQQASGVNFGNVRRQGRFLRAAAAGQPLARDLGPAEGTARRGRRVPGQPATCAVLRRGAGGAAGRELCAATPRLGLDLEFVSGSSAPAPLSLLRPGGRSAARIRPTTAMPIRAWRHRPSAVRRRARGPKVVENTEIVASIDKAGEDFRASAQPTAGSFRAPVRCWSAPAPGPTLSAAFGEPVPLHRRTAPHGRDRAGALRDRAGGRRGRPPIEVESRVFPPGQARQHRLRRRPRGPAIPDLRRAYVLPDEHPAQLRRCRRLAPALGRLSIIRTWSGIEGLPARRAAGHGPQPGSAACTTPSASAATASRRARRRRRDGRTDRHRRHRNPYRDLRCRPLSFPPPDGARRVVALGNPVRGAGGIAN